MRKAIFIILTLAGFASGAEWEAADKLTVDGSAMFKSTVTIGSRSIQTYMLGLQEPSGEFVLQVATTGNMAVGTTAVSGSRFSVLGSTKAAYVLTAGTGTAYSFVVSTTGNVGIGTTGPGAQLDAQGATNVLLVSGTHDKGFLIGDNAAFVDVVGINKELSAYNDISIKAVSAAGQVYLSTSGNVGIGTTGPNDTLAVNGSITATGLQDTGKTTRMWLSGAIADQTLDYMEYANNAAAQAAYVSNAVGSELQDQSNTNAAQNGNLGYPGWTYQSQSFVAGASGKFTKFSVQLKIAAGSPSMTITGYLYSNNAGKPGTLLSTLSNMSASVLTGSFVTYSFTIDAASAYSVVSGTTYWLVLGTSLQNSGNYVYVECNSSNPYPNGNQDEGDGTPTWTVQAGNDLWFKTYYTTPNDLYAYSEAAITNQGSYSLKGIATTSAAAKTLTRTVSPTIDLTGRTRIKFDIYAGRTGSNIKIGLHDATGGITSEIIPNVASANAWQTVTWDISGVSNANKDAIDTIIITIVNADAVNTFYLDNMYSPSPGVSSDITFTTGGSERMRINTSGNVGIGTAGPGYALTVNGTAWCTNGSWSGSDKRWKKEINPLKDSLNSVMNLQGVSYYWRTDEFPGLAFTKEEQIGLLAQDVEKVIPEVVTTDKEGYKGISYEKLVPVLVEAIKEQQKEIEILKSKMAKLEKGGEETR